MALPPTRIDDKIHAAKFRAFAGLVVDIQPHYCNILDPDVADVKFSPVIVWHMGTRRVCVDTDITWDMGVGAGPAGWSYSPNFDPTDAGATADNLDTYSVDWGDGQAPIVGQAYPPGGPPPNDTTAPGGAHGGPAAEWPLVGGESSHTYTITITLTDDDGYSTIIYEQIEIVDCVAFPFDAYAGLGGGGGVYRVGSPWVARNTGLTGDWLTVNDLDINYGVVVGGEPEIWIATNGGLAYSRNGGVTWSLIALDDPPNSWGDAPAPTAQSVTYYKIARKNSAEFIVLVYYKNVGAAYRGYMLRTEDNGLTFTWYNLGGVTQANATWGLPDRVILPWWCDERINRGWAGAGSPTRTLVNPHNILFDNGVGGGARVDFSSRAANNLCQRLLLLDLGTYITLQNATQDGGINNQWRLVSSQDTMTVADQTQMELYVHATSYDQFRCNCCISVSLASLVGAPYPFNTPQIASSLANATEPIRWLWVSLYAYDDYSGTGFHRHLIDWIKVYPHTVIDELWPLTAMFSKGTGRWLYMTTLEGGKLHLRVYDTNQSYSYPALSIVMSSAVSSIQIEGFTYWLGVQAMQDRSKAYMDRHCILHGRFGWVYQTGMTNFYEGTGLEEPIYYDWDGSWTDDSLAAATDWVGEVVWPTEDKVYLFINDAGACEVHVTDDYGASWTNLGAIGVGKVAHRCAMDNPDYWEEYIAGRQAAGGAPRARYTMDDAANWFDTDTDLPANAVQVLRILSDGL